MISKPDSRSAMFWANTVAVIGQFYLLLSLLVGVFLFLYKDEMCSEWDGCSFLEERPLALAGLAAVLSGVTFAAPMIALGKYFMTQLQFQNFDHGIEISPTPSGSPDKAIPTNDGTY